MSTRCTAPHARAAGSTRWATLWVPKVTVTSAVTCGPSSSPVSTATPDGVSTATIGTPATAARACSASGFSPGRPPIPTIPSITTSGLRGSATTRPPAWCRAAKPSRCGFSESSNASTCTPRRASTAPAYRASPPLSPEPTSSNTRRPYAEPSRSRTAYARPCAARCIRAPSGSSASSASSAARTCSTVCACLTGLTLVGMRAWPDDRAWDCRRARLPGAGRVRGVHQRRATRRSLHVARGADRVGRQRAGVVLRRHAARREADRRARRPGGSVRGRRHRRLLDARPDADVHQRPGGHHPGSRGRRLGQPCRVGGPVGARDRRPVPWPDRRLRHPRPAGGSLRHPHRRAALPHSRRAAGCW